MILCLNIIVLLILAHITMATTTKKRIRGSSVKYMRDKQELNVKFTEDHIEEPIKENRRLTSTTGVKTVLAVRITVTNSVNSLTNSFDETKLIEKVFKKDDNWKDNWNLVNAMSKCSFGKLKIEPPAAVPRGVATVTIDNAVTYEAGKRHSWKDTIESIKDEAKKKLDELYGKDIYDLVDEVMYCIPNIGIWNDGIGDYMAKASGAGGQWTVYNDEACLKPSYQMHEIGHNLDIAHAGNKEEDGNRYSDTSGVMGSSYGSFGGPIMCFHGAANYQLGWFQDRTETLNDKLKWKGKLIGLVDYENDNKESSVLIDIDDGTEFRYVVSFNRKSSFNSGTDLGGDKVFIHKRNRNGGWSQSWIVAMMGEGDEQVIHDIGPDGDKKKVMVTVRNIDLTSEPAFAKIRIKYHADDAPTKPPISSGMGECGVNTPIKTSECPTNTQDLNIFNCQRVAYGELCNAKGFCGTSVNLDNCGKYNIYRKTLKPPKQQLMKDTGINMCKKNIPLHPKKCPKVESELNLKTCDQVAYGELCEGDGECDTNPHLNNCNFSDNKGYDVYVKCGDVQPILEKDCPKKKIIKKLQKCSKAGGNGTLCKGDNICAAKKLRNCNNKYDVYRKIG